MDRVQDLLRVRGRRIIPIVSVSIILPSRLKSASKGRLPVITAIHSLLAPDEARKLGLSAPSLRTLINHLSPFPHLTRILY